jgi:hypothetical protein
MRFKANDREAESGKAGVMMPKKHLHTTQERAIAAVWQRGLSDTQIQIVNTLDKWFDEYPDGPTLHEMMDLTGLSFGAIWKSLGVLEFFGYVIVNRTRKGRIVNRGVVLIVGFDAAKDL